MLESSSQAAVPPRVAAPGERAPESPWPAHRRRLQGPANRRQPGQQATRLVGTPPEQPLTAKTDLRQQELCHTGGAPTARGKPTADGVQCRGGDPRSGCPPAPKRADRRPNFATALTMVAGAGTFHRSFTYTLPG